MIRYLISFVLICVVSQLHAQKFSWGLKGGLNVANQTVTLNGQTDQVSNMITFHAGLFTIVKFTDRLGIQPEVLYSVQGWHADVLGPVELKMEYITVPVLFRYNANSLIHLDLGPQMGVLMSAKATAFGLSNDLKDQYHDYDWSLAMGAGVDLPSKVTIGFRYVLGLIDVDKSDAMVAKNTTIQFSLGFRF